MSRQDHETDRHLDKEGGRFKIKDRRHFTAAGERRPEMTDEAEEAQGNLAAQPKEAPSPTPPATAGFERRPLDEPEGVDFTMLVNAMAQPALLFLGEIPHPATGERTLDPEQARIQIDMLGLLAVKCRGNLSAAEEKLLDRVLYQLRMLYVSRAPGTR